MWNKFNSYLGNAIITVNLYTSLVKLQRHSAA